MKQIIHPLSITAITLSLLGCPSEAKETKTPKAPPKTKTTKAASQAAPVPAGDRNPAMLDPNRANATAPDKYTVKFETTKGDILIDVQREWAPLGADRFYNLVKIGYYDDIAFFRVISGFMAQFGIHGDPAISKIWRNARISDDKVVQSNKPGTVSFATSGKNSRTTQVFINFGDNARLDGMGFAAFGKVRDMKIVNQIHSEYGEGAPRGRGPSQGRIQNMGNEYLRKSFPELDYIKKATIVE